MFTFPSKVRSSFLRIPPIPPLRAIACLTTSYQGQP